MRGTAARESVDGGGGRYSSSRWSLFLGRGGATRYPEIRRTWQREGEEGRLEGRPGSRSNNAQRWQCVGRACVAAAVMVVCVVVCSSVCADRQQRVRVDEHSGTATGAKSSSSSSSLQQRRQASERDREPERERAAGTLRFEWLNTLQSHPILTPSLRTNPCEMSVKSGRFSSLSSGRSHILHSILYIHYVTRAERNASAYLPSYSLPKHVTPLSSLPF